MLNMSGNYQMPSQSYRWSEIEFVAAWVAWWTFDEISKGRGNLREISKQDHQSTLQRSQHQDPICIMRFIHFRCYTWQTFALRSIEIDAWYWYVTFTIRKRQWGDSFCFKVIELILNVVKFENEAITIHRIYWRKLFHCRNIRAFFVELKRWAWLAELPWSKSSPSWLMSVTWKAVTQHSISY